MPNVYISLVLSQFLRTSSLPCNFPMELIDLITFYYPFNSCLDFDIYSQGVLIMKSFGNYVFTSNIINNNYILSSNAWNAGMNYIGFEIQSQNINKLCFGLISLSGKCYSTNHTLNSIKDGRININYNDNQYIAYKYLYYIDKHESKLIYHLSNCLYRSFCWSIFGMFLRSFYVG